MAMNGQRVISADSHVLEPHDLWTARMAGGPFADRAPHMVEHETHGHLFIIDDLKPFPIGLAGAAGKPSDDLRASGDTAETLRAGGWDPDVRLDDMDTDGVAAEVLYPSIGMTLAQSKDRDYQIACIRAYNDWLVEFCAAGKGRLVGLAMIPTIDPDAAVDEIERACGRGAARCDGAGRSPRRSLRRAAVRSDVVRVRRCGLAGVVPHPHGRGRRRSHARFTARDAHGDERRAAGAADARPAHLRSCLRPQPALEGGVGRARRRLGRALRLPARPDVGTPSRLARARVRRARAPTERVPAPRMCGSRSRRTRWRWRPGPGSASTGSCGPATTPTPTRRGRTPEGHRARLRGRPRQPTSTPSSPATPPRCTACSRDHRRCRSSSRSSTTAGWRKAPSGAWSTASTRRTRGS